MLAALPVVLGGRYRLERLIDRGGMGAVYEAVQLDLGRRVAIKVLDARRGLDPQAEERFAREAQMAARLASPHTVLVSDFVPSRGNEPAFLVMELLSGLSLQRLLSSDVMLAPPRAVGIMLQILHVLGEAHRAGIIHRDVKPGNVFLVATQLRQDFVKVLDFGLARFAEGAAITSGGSRAGTLAFMAPEQASGLVLDGRADLYAASATLYTMLTGRLVVHARTMEELVHELRTQLPPPPSALTSGIDPELDAIVLRGLAKDREQRFPSAEIFAQALDRWSRGASAFGTFSASTSTSSWAPPPAPLPLAEKAPAVERKRTGIVIAAVAVLALSLVGMGAVIVWLQSRAQPVPVAQDASSPPTSSSSMTSSPSVAPAALLDAAAPVASTSAPKVTPTASARPSGRVVYSLKRTDSEALSTDMLLRKLGPPIDACIQTPSLDARSHLPGKIEIGFGATRETSGKVRQINYRSKALLEGTERDINGFVKLVDCFRARIRPVVLDVSTEREAGWPVNIYFAIDVP